MPRFTFTLPLVLSFAAVPIHAVGLPDTGQDTCYNDTMADSVVASDPASISRDGGTHPRQDCRYGRDAAAAAGMLAKNGAGTKGFDYSKIANNGSTLAAGATLGTAATDWACTQDNITGLTWEVKTATSTDLRYFGHTYTWYSTNGSTNGGDAGNTGSNTCDGTLPGSQCNTQAFTTAVNAVQLCTYSDWRMPTIRELHTLVYSAGLNSSIDPTYFPNTPYTGGTDFWSGSTYAGFPANAWAVIFYEGDTFEHQKTASHRVRLVRGAQF